MKERTKLCVQYSQYILSVGCSVVVEESGDVAVETDASSDTVDLCSPVEQIYSYTQSEQSSLPVFWYARTV